MVVCEVLVQMKMVCSPLLHSIRLMVIVGQGSCCLILVGDRPGEIREGREAVGISRVTSVAE